MNSRHKIFVNKIIIFWELIFINVTRPLLRNIRAIRDLFALLALFSLNIFAFSFFNLLCLFWTNHASLASGGTVQSTRLANCKEMNDVATIRCRYVSFSLFAFHFYCIRRDVISATSIILSSLFIRHNTRITYKNYLASALSAP